MKRSSKKGFTLAELLIVIAIIAVLIAIMFPVFGAQLNKAKLAADIANVRSAYSEAVADALTGEITLDENGKVAVSIDEAVATNGSDVTVSGTTVTVTLNASNVDTFEIDEDVTLTINERAAS